MGKGIENFLEHLQRQSDYLDRLYWEIDQGAGTVETEVQASFLARELATASVNYRFNRSSRVAKAIRAWL